MHLLITNLGTKPMYQTSDITDEPHTIGIVVKPGQSIKVLGVKQIHFSRDPQPGVDYQEGVEILDH